MDKRGLYNELVTMVEKLADVAGINHNQLQYYYYPEGKKQLNGENGYLNHLAVSLQNSGRMRNSIKYDDIDYRNVIKKVLCDYDVMKAINKYQDWKSLYDAILAAGIKDNGIKKERESNWEKYCRGLYDGIRFLTDSKGEEEINNLIDAHNLIPLNAKIERIKKISKEIHGFGFALTCDWLKECGCIWLAKPDVHIKTVVNYMRNGQINDKISDSDVIREVYNWAEDIGRKDVTPYKIDKIIWLLCTGNFYLNNKSIGRNAVIVCVDRFK